MDLKLIEPFMLSIQNVLMTMMQLPVSVGMPRLKHGFAAPRDVSGVIGMSGDVNGSVVLSFPIETAESVVMLFCGERLERDEAEFADAIGELANMVAGGAKANLGLRSVSIACPSVVVGPGHFIAQQKGMPCVVIPCMTDLGGFSIEIAIRQASEVEEVQSSSARARA